MKVEIHPCLIDLRRAANRAGMAVMRQPGRIVMYPKPTRSGPYQFNADQLRGQEAMKLASLGWKLLSPDQQRAWDAWALRYSFRFDRQSADLLRGRRVYCGAAVRRLMLAADPPDEAPLTAPPPPPPGRLELLPLESGQPANLFRFRLDHGCATEGVLLVARIGAATLRPSRKPKRNMASLVHGFSPASAIALPPSGSLIEFADARVGIQAGERFGVWLYTLRATDGIASAERFYDLIR